MPKEEIKEQEQTSKDKVKVPAKYKDLVKQIEDMSVLELSELVKVLEDKFGVSAAAPVAVAAASAPGAGGEGEAPAEKSMYNVELTDAGSQKIAVIKAIREVTELGLKEAKELTDKTPAMVKENVPKDEAEEMKKKVEEAGGKVELK